MIGGTSNIMDKSGLRKEKQLNKEIRISDNSVVTAAVNHVEINAVNFPDEGFREYVSRNFDNNGAGFLCQEEINKVRSVNVSFNDKITNLKGIEFFCGLKRLVCCGTKIKNLDVSKNASLIYLDCSYTKIKELDITRNIRLEDLHCNNTEIKNLDLSKNAFLYYLDCSGTEIEDLDISKNTRLIYLHCNHTGIENLDITNNTSLLCLSCGDTKIKKLDIAHKSRLIYLLCNDMKFKELDVDSSFDEWRNSNRIRRKKKDYSLLQPGKLIMIGGRTISYEGKLALGIAQQVACRMKIPTLIISEEAAKEKTVNCLNSMEYGVNALSGIPSLSELGWKELTDEVLFNKKLHLIIDDKPCMYIQELQDKCENYKKEYGLGLIVIDDMQLLRGYPEDENSCSREKESMDIASGLKHLAENIDVPIVLCSNMSRVIEYRKVAMISDVCFSQYIDDIIFFGPYGRREYYLDNVGENWNHEECIILQKNGISGRVKLKWLPEYDKFING